MYKFIKFDNSVILVGKYVDSGEIALAFHLISHYNLFNSFIET